MNFKSREPCPRCRERGNDRSGDNLIVFPDGNKRCFACGYYVPIKGWVIKSKEEVNAKSNPSLPSDFTREVPTAGWRWLLQYGLTHTYWKDHIGYSEKEQRLYFTIGNPIRFSQGRDLTGEHVKWKTYGKPHDVVTVLGDKAESPCTVLVEDIISAHKVSQVTRCIPLFGTAIMSPVIQYLSTTKEPIVLWLDADQLPQMKKKVSRLAVFLPNDIRVAHTEKDPKCYSIKEIREILLK